MSRIGKQPITIPAGVTVEINQNVVTIKGSKGELKRELKPQIKVEVQENEIILSRPDNTSESKAFHGLYRSLLANMVEGVSK